MSSGGTPAHRSEARTYALAQSISGWILYLGALLHFIGAPGTGRSSAPLRLLTLRLGTGRSSALAAHALVPAHAHGVYSLGWGLAHALVLVHVCARW